MFNESPREIARFIAGERSPVNKPRSVGTTKTTADRLRRFRRDFHAARQLENAGDAFGDAIRSALIGTVDTSTDPDLDREIRTEKRRIAFDKRIRSVRPDDAWIDPCVDAMGDAVDLEDLARRTQRARRARVVLSAWNTIRLSRGLDYALHVAACVNGFQSKIGLEIRAWIVPLLECAHAFADLRTRGDGPPVTVRNRKGNVYTDRPRRFDAPRAFAPAIASPINREKREISPAAMRGEIGGTAKSPRAVASRAAIEAIRSAYTDHAFPHVYDLARLTREHARAVAVETERRRARRHFAIFGRGNTDRIVARTHDPVDMGDTLSRSPARETRGTHSPA
jgi:hypothetical protein